MVTANEIGYGESELIFNYYITISYSTLCIWFNISWDKDEPLFLFQETKKAKTLQVNNLILFALLAKCKRRKKILGVYICNKDDKEEQRRKGELVFKFYCEHI